MNFAVLAQQLLEHGRKLLDLKNLLPAGAPEFIEAAKSLKPLVASIKGFADPPTRAALDALEAEVFAGLDDTISKLRG